MPIWHFQNKIRNQKIKKLRSRINGNIFGVECVKASSQSWEGSRLFDLYRQPSDISSLYEENNFFNILPKYHPNIFLFIFPISCHISKYKNIIIYKKKKIHILIRDR